MAGDLAGDEFEAAAGRLVVVEDAAAGEEVVGLAVVAGEVESGDLGDAVRRAGIERRILGLGCLTNLAEHFR